MHNRSWWHRENRPFTPAELLADAIVHAIGIGCSLFAGVLLLTLAQSETQPHEFIALVIYVTSLVGLLSVSLAFNIWPVTPMKMHLARFDQAAIFLFIAGTYTPFTVGVLRGPWGWALFGLVWGLALAGIAFKVLRGAARHPRLSTAAYLGLGWLFLVAAGPVWRLMPSAGLLWLLAGGLAYTIGVAFFRAEGTRYAHVVWHGFVLVGTVCHFVAVLYYGGGG